MAERQEERNIQRIVAAVISNLHSVPSLSEASSSSENSSNRFGLREEEIRNAFFIPRDAASPATVANGVDGNEASSSSQNTSVAVNYLVFLKVRIADCCSATTDVQRASAYASIYDVYDTEKRDKLISAKENDELQELNSSEPFLNVLQDSGLVTLPNVDNSIAIAEAMVSYHVLVKRAVMLDNFAKGLQTLGILEEIRKNPSQFEEVFLHNENAVSASAVLQSIVFKPEDATMYAMLASFINDASEQELESLLKFITGISSVPFVRVALEVNSTSTSIFASTCLMKLCLPAMLGTLDQESFNSSMSAAIRQEGKEFTSC
ncbi:G2 M phase-specific E3 ubiquitin- ligase-like [Paramuricea clavata]|uniref:G2 M phase-specific E3 ubiquitin- ligase-like n=1 Tax=Paramuricea clavata TaxID=317549 RepID=A0A6S7GID5_PARCT|nr:G2 M phase-specific E3 ubiquitin- ligase-like [Paramuricea clavata]